MSHLRRTLRRLRREQFGGTAIEYGLIAGLIAAVLIAGVTTLGSQLNTTLGVVAADVAAAG